MGSGFIVGGVAGGCDHGLLDILGDVGQMDALHLLVMDIDDSAVARGSTMDQLHAAANLEEAELFEPNLAGGQVLVGAKLAGEEGQVAVGQSGDFPGDFQAAIGVFDSVDAEVEVAGGSADDSAGRSGHELEREEAFAGSDFSRVQLIFVGAQLDNAVAFGNDKDKRGVVTLTNNGEYDGAGQSCRGPEFRGTSHW